MPARIRQFDWAATPLGALEQWPASLRFATALLLRSPAPMALLWGRDGVMVYNDAYRGIAASRHPGCLGSRIRESWPEIADFNERVLSTVLGGEPLSFPDQELVLHRNAQPELVWLHLTYAPVIGEDGLPAGVLATLSEATQQVLAERASRDRQRRQQLLLQQMPGFVAVLRGPQHVFEYFNDAYRDLAGPRAFLGRAVREVFPDIADQGYFELLDRVYATGERFVGRGIAVRLHSQPEPRYIDLLYEAIKDDSGAVTGIFVGGYDSSESYRTAAALAASEARLRLVISGAKDHAILTTDASGLITSWSAGAESIFGWSALEAIGQPLSMIYTPEDRAAGTEALELHMATREGSVSETRWHLRKTGGRVYMNGSTHRLSAEGSDALEAYLKIMRDETHRRRSDEALSEQRTQQLRDSMDFARLALTAVSGVGVWTYDVASDRFFCDSAISKLYDIDAAAGAAGILRLDFLANVVAEDREALTATMAGGLLRAGDLELEYRVRHRDGSIRWVLSRGHTYFDSAGKPLRRVGVGVDMTRYRLLELQLHQSQKMEAVGQLTGGLAHDFNNLLTGIIGSLEILQARVAQGNVGTLDRYVTAAQGAARRAAALTHRLLAFSRRQTLDPKSTDVNRLAADLEELVRRTVGPLIDIEVIGAAGLWPIRVDPNQLENALLNLCINARDAMPDGGRITIETVNKPLDERAAAERELPPGQYITLCVTDTGAGMTPEVIARAFDPFFTTKPIGEGTGLGLSMVYGFMRQSGGQVRIYSELNVGTSMCLYFPRDLAAPDGATAAAHRELVEGRGAGEVVLVVDDEPTIRMLIAEVLEQAGFAGIEAADGPSGLRLLQSDAKIDLLISDVGLPGGLNGRQLADAARVLRPGLKVLFITGYAENAVMGDGRLDHGMEVLTKPFSIEALSLRIKRMLGTGDSGA